jgi:transposase
MPAQGVETEMAKTLSKTGRSAGRPRGSAPLLTSKFVSAFLKHVSQGIPIQTIAEMMGVSKSTIYDWRKKGVDDHAAGRDTLYRNFSDGLTRGLASVRGAMVAKIVKASKTEWRAALAYLERRDPDQWSQKRALEHSGEITVDSAVDRAAARTRMDGFVAYMASDEGCAEADRISDELTRVALLE